MEYRIAVEKDFYALSKMRWDFKMEGKEVDNGLNKDEFLNECEMFFKEGQKNGDWTHWIALDEDTIISHISIKHIRKIPKPNRLKDEYGYVTNVYTKPEYRGKGIGSQLMDRVIDWAKDIDFEILIVWPSDTAIKFYERKGFNNENDVMELTLRPDM